MSQDLPSRWQQLAESKGIRPTVRGIAEAAGVSPSTVSRLVFNATTSTQTVHAVAAALGISQRDVRAHAGMPSAELGPWDPPDAAHLLTGKQRRALTDLIRAFAPPEPQATVTSVSELSRERRLDITPANMPPETVTLMRRAAERQVHVAEELLREVDAQIESGAVDDTEEIRDLRHRRFVAPLEQAREELDALRQLDVQDHIGA